MSIFLGGKVYLFPQEVKRQIGPLPHFVGTRVSHALWASGLLPPGTLTLEEVAGEQKQCQLLPVVMVRTRFRAQSHWWSKERVKFLQVLLVMS